MYLILFAAGYERLRFEALNSCGLQELEKGFVPHRQSGVEVCTTARWSIIEAGGDKAATACFRAPVTPGCPVSPRPLRRKKLRSCVDDKVQFREVHYRANAVTELLCAGTSSEDTPEDLWGARHVMSVNFISFFL